jgi:hypothetical protein
LRRRGAGHIEDGNEGCGSDGRLDGELMESFEAGGEKVEETSTRLVIQHAPHFISATLSLSLDDDMDSSLNVKVH